MTGGGFRYRLIDLAGSELGIVSDARAEIGEGDTVEMVDGTGVGVIEVYDDDVGREGGVQATLAVDVE